MNAVGTQLRQLISREIKSQDKFMTGTVISPKRFVDYDGSSSGAPLCVVDIDVAGRAPLRSVPVKAHNGGRSYANLGLPVMLSSNTNGRYDVIGPADRVTAFANITEYTIETTVAETPELFGFTFFRVPFEYYKGVGSPAPTRWADGVTGFPLTLIVDQDGNPVT